MGGKGEGSGGEGGGKWGRRGREVGGKGEGTGNGVPPCPPPHTEKHAICLKDYRIRSFLSIRHAHGDLCKHLGIDSRTDLDDRYSNLFLNAYINRHAHTEYLKMI